MSLPEHPEDLFILPTVFRGLDQLHLVRMVNQCAAVPAVDAELHLVLSYTLIEGFSESSGHPKGSDRCGPTSTVGVNSVAYSPDGWHIISGSSDISISLWDLETSHPIQKSLIKHTAQVQSDGLLYWIP